MNCNILIFSPGPNKTKNPEFQKELKNEVTREKSDRKKKPKPQEDTMQITASSKPDDVKKWLKDKGFSSTYVDLYII